MASVAAASFFCSSLIQALIIQNHSDYVPERYQETLLFWGAGLIAVFANVVVSAALPKLEWFILMLHIIGFFAILIPLVFLGHRGSIHDIFTTFLNGRAWPTQ